MPSAPADRGLFVVATPIGNLADLTDRARRVLGEVDVVAAEDTRRARGLLSHLGITGKELVRLDAHATDVDVARLADRIAEGVRVALVTDAGTPGVSDPGSALVRAVHSRGAHVVAIPGPSAVSAAISVAGFATTAFRFVGFLPRGLRERTEALSRIAADPDVVVFFEAPQRIAETLADFARIVPDRELCVARELTKLHEELLRGTAAELAERTIDRDWLGEITVVVGPRTAVAPAAVDDEGVDRRIELLLAEGRRAREVAEIVALETGLPKREVYERVNRKKR
jgi:16S rRNA (cytidine1402-2'-O)-methyltransferase